MKVNADGSTSVITERQARVELGFRDKIIEQSAYYTDCCGIEAQLQAYMTWEGGICDQKAMSLGQRLWRRVWSGQQMLEKDLDRRRQVNPYPNPDPDPNLNPNPATLTLNPLEP